MGNKVNKSSPTECIHDLIYGKISFQTCTTEEIATHLDIVIFLGTNIANGEIEISIKQLPDLIQVYGIIIKFLDDLYFGVVNDSHSIDCLKKALQAIIRLLVIPQVSKKVFENSLISITNHLDVNNIEIFSLSFLAFFLGFRHFEEEPSEQVSLRSVGPEEALRQQICLQLDKHDLFSNLLSFLLQTSSQQSSASQITTSILIFRLFSWILNRTASSTNQLRVKLRYLLIQHQETIFELLKHEDKTLSDAAVWILALILKQEERGTCIALQETSRTYGVILWTLTRLTKCLIILKKNIQSTQDDKISYRIDSVDSSFLPPLEVPLLVDILDHLKIFITLIVVGNKTNADLVLAAYPKYIREFLTPSSSFMIQQMSRYVEVIDESSSIYLQLFLEKMVGSVSNPGDKIGSTWSPNWYLMLSSLKADIEIPILVWNTNTLEYLLQELQRLEESLNFARQVRHEAWDSRYLDINYSTFFTAHYQYVLVTDIFIHRIIDVLEIGKTEFIRNPISFAWALIEEIFLCKEMKHIPNSNQCNCDEGIVDGKDLLLLRTLDLLYLRYQDELADIPLTTFHKLLQSGVSSLDSSCEPQWIHHCVNILSIRQTKSSQRALSAFVTSGCVDILLYILSSYHIFENILQYNETDEDNSDNDNEDDDDPDHRHDDNSNSNNNNDSSRGNESDMKKISQQSLSRKASIYISRRMSKVSSSHVVNRLQGGENVIVNIATLLFHLTHESNYCSLYLGSLTPSTHSIFQMTTTTISTITTSSPSSNITSLEKLLRAVWLVSCHGPNRPYGITVALEKLLLTIMRVFHSSPISIYPSLLSQTQILRIVLATGVTPTGEGVLLPVAVDLLSDILLSIPFYLPPQNSDSITSNGQSSGDKLQDSIQIATQIVKERSSLRQVILTEKKDNSIKSKSSPSSSSATSMSSTMAYLNLLGSDIIMNYSHSTQSFAPLPPVMNEITSIIPYQLATFLYQLPSNIFCSQVFNVSNIQKPDVIWNTILRQDLIVSLYHDLSPWYQLAFNRPLGFTDVVNVSPMKYITLSGEPQLSGIYLVHLINTTNSLDFMSVVDVRSFSKDILRTLQATMGAVRRNSISNTTNTSTLNNTNTSSSTSSSISSSLPSSSLSSTLKQNTSNPLMSSRRDSKALYDSKNSHLGYNESFFEMPPEKQSGYLLLSLSKLIEILPFPDDVWYDDGLPTLSNLLEFYSRILASLDGIGINQLIPKSTLASSSSSSYSSSTSSSSLSSLSLSSPPSTSSPSSTEISIEAYSCCLFCLLQSLFPANLIRDEGRKSKQLNSLQKVFSNYRVDAGSAYSPFILHKLCSSVMSSMKLSLTYWTSPLKGFNSTILDQYFNLSLAFSLTFLLQLSRHCYDTIYPYDQAQDFQIREERKSFGRSNLIPDDVNYSPPNGVPSEILLCLRGLFDTRIFDDAITCVSSRIVSSSPYATLHSIISLRFFILMNTEYQTQLIDLIVSRGLIIYLLDLIMTLLTDDIPSYTTKEFTYGFHSALISFDKFSEKVPLPLNRRRGSVQNSVVVESSGGPRLNSNNITSLAVHGAPDLSYYANLDDACRDFIKRGGEHLKKSVLSSKNTLLSTSENLSEQFHVAAIPDLVSLHKLIIYESTLLLRNIISVATFYHKKSPPATTAAASSSTASTNHVIVSLLDYLLTPSLHHVLLYNLSLFLEIFRSNKSIKRPLVIWNSQMFSILKEFIRSEITRLESSDHDDDDDKKHDVGGTHSIPIPSHILEKDSYKLLYPTLSEEILIDGIFVNLLIDPQHRDDIGARNLHAFVEQLQASITSNKRVLELVQQQQQQHQHQHQQRRQSISKTSLVSQVSIKQQVLNHILREHPELGYSDLYVVDEQNN